MATIMITTDYCTVVEAIEAQPGDWTSPLGKAVLWNDIEAALNLAAKIQAGEDEEFSEE